MNPRRIFYAMGCSGSQRPSPRRTAFHVAMSMCCCASGAAILGSGGGLIGFLLILTGSILGGMVVGAVTAKEPPE
jgi:hypothetical protein